MPRVDIGMSGDVARVSESILRILGSAAAKRQVRVTSLRAFPKWRPIRKEKSSQHRLLDPTGRVHQTGHFEKEVSLT